MRSMRDSTTAWAGPNGEEHDHGRDASTWLSRDRQGATKGLGKPETSNREKCR